MVASSPEIEKKRDRKRERGREKERESERGERAREIVRVREIRTG